MIVIRLVISRDRDEGWLLLMMVPLSAWQWAWCGAFIITVNNNSNMMAFNWMKKGWEQASGARSRDNEWKLWGGREHSGRANALRSGRSMRKWSRKCKRQWLRGLLCEQCAEKKHWQLGHFYGVETLINNWQGCIRVGKDGKCQVYGREEQDRLKMSCQWNFLFLITKKCFKNAVEISFWCKMM